MFKSLLIFGGGTISAGFIFTNCSITENFKIVSALTESNFNKFKKWDYNWDAVDLKKSEKSKATRHIILIRHGQYYMKKDDVDCKLTSLGCEQANFTGRRLKELGIRYDKIIHSTMTRAVETAKLISKHIPEVIMSCDSELVEGTPYVNEPFLPNWIVPENVIKKDNIRIENAFNKYFYRARKDQEKDSFEILVCHANVIRYLICRALQFPPEGWARISLDHGSMSWISIKPDGSIAVRSIGNSGFMEPNMTTVV